MEKDFLPYELAFELKQLGFDEPCFGYYHEDKSLTYTNLISQNTNSFWKINNKIVSAPLYQQAFRWFREKYGMYHIIIYQTHKDEFDVGLVGKGIPNFKEDVVLKTYEEAELECLKKLIEIVKNK